MVAMIPRRHSHFWKPYLRLTAPDIVFVPSYASLLALSRCSLKGELIPLGVDLEVFRPPTSGERKALREKHGLSNGSFVFLHVGHLSRKRNLGKLCRLCSGKDKSEVIVVGSTSTPEDASLRGELEKAGVRVIREYVKVEEYYRLADCYVFPVVEREGSIEFPLSVLEALASGLPVLTTPFGGLRDFLPEGPDVIYWNTSSELVAAAERLKISARPATRSMDEFYWPRIAEGLLKKLDLLDENQ
jgi:glycosyltransferase involved in cell wall biosynthesis